MTSDSGSPDDIKRWTAERWTAKRRAALVVEIVRSDIHTAEAPAATD